MLELPNVTLVSVGNGAGELTKEALKDCLKLVKPAAVHHWGNAPLGLGETHHMAHVSTMMGYVKILWRFIPFYVETSHLLHFQWDGWILNPEAWTDEFLTYDYVGALWPWHAYYRVGNGGFSLRSTYLMQHVAKYPDKFPEVKQEDEGLCRTYRAKLEAWGAKYAPEQMAKRFSVEHGRPGNLKPFGFHDCRNWPRLLGWEETLRRVSLANDYVKAKLEFKALMKSVDYYRRTIGATASSQAAD